MKIGREAENGNQNVYFQARKRASSYNAKLYSREGAAEMLGVSVSTLADYELGNTKVVPVDKVILMADLYNAPELKYQYCKHECPIGRNLPVATEQVPVERIALRVLNELDAESVAEMLKTILTVAADGEIDESELDLIAGVSEKMSGIQKTINEFQLMAEKLLRGK